MSAQHHEEARPIEFTGCRPILFVSDMRASLTFYVDKLGFTEGWDLTDRIVNPDGRDRVTFCYVFCSNFELFLREVESPHAGEIVVGCESSEKVDRAHEAAWKQGARPSRSPQREPGVDALLHERRQRDTMAP